MNVREQIEEQAEGFTPAERKLASALLSDYPFAGLETIQSFAEKTHTSAPSITRFVSKLGCAGYQEFQRRLIDELKERQHSPVDLRQDAMPVGDGFLRRFLERTSDVVNRVSEGVTEDQFERVQDLLSDDKRSIFLIGGRVSDPIAQTLSRHLRQIRRDVYHLPPDPEVWPEYLLRMRSRDIFVIVDFRRYEKRLSDLAEMAAESRGARVLLITDKWLSPVARYAAEVMALPIESGTAWDSYCGALALVEALITAVAERDWEATKKRIGGWDALRPNFGAGDVET